mgnify:CR=1 FL=1
MSNSPTIVFDIDGTLANCEHRIHWVRSTPKNWPAFNRGMKRDTAHEDIVWMLRTFHAAGCTILIASGRSEDERAVTEAWLRDIAGIGDLYAQLYMRASKDYRSDDIVKSEILDHMRAFQRDQQAWFRVAEASIDNFMSKQKF